MENGFPKYQYSEFTKLNGKDGQFVIRADTWEEFIEEKKKLDTIMAKHPEASQNSSQEPTEKVTKTCGIHGTPLTLIPAGFSKKTNKPYNSFYICNTKNADGSNCSYKPVK